MEIDTVVDGTDSVMLRERLNNASRTAPLKITVRWRGRELLWVVG